jgi:Kelch motif
MLWKLRLAAGPALALVLLVPQAALGMGVASFDPTGSMGAARYAAVAAPLPDGRVLVAGGYYDEGGDHYLASAEVFNPATNAFSSAGIGAMGTARRAPAAAPLPDGRVLVAGGVYDDGTEHYLASAEVFNPATNAFSSAGIGAMSTARSGAAAAPLPDGRVLVAGGFDGADRLQSAELFALAPRGRFKFRLRGTKLIFNAPVAGKVTVRDAAAKAGGPAAAAKKKKRRALKTSNARGGPGKITVRLRLAGKAKKRFNSKGRAKVRAKVEFAPSSQCVVKLFKYCYDGGTETAKLKIKKRAKKN